MAPSPIKTDSTSPSLLPEVWISPENKTAVASLLKEVLVVGEEDAQAMMADGKITRDEFYRSRHQMRAFPTINSMRRTPARNVLNENFLAEAGLTPKFYADFYDTTFGIAANISGQPGIIDTPDDLQNLQSRFSSEMIWRRNHILWEVTKKALAFIRANAETSPPVIVMLDENVIQVTLDIIDSPIRPEEIKRIVFDHPEEQALAAKGLYQSLVMIAPNYKEGKLVKGVNYVKNLSPKDAYVHLTIQDEKTDEKGLVRLSIQMRQLDETEIRGQGLPLPANPPKSFMGKITLERTPQGGTTSRFVVQSDPGLFISAGGVFGWLFSVKEIFAEQLFQANVDLGVYLTMEVYYKQCLALENQTDPKTGQSLSPCYEYRKNAPLMVR